MFFKKKKKRTTFFSKRILKALCTWNVLVSYETILTELNWILKTQNYLKLLHSVVFTKQEVSISFPSVRVVYQQIQSGPCADRGVYRVDLSSCRMRCRFREKLKLMTDDGSHLQSSSFPLQPEPHGSNVLCVVVLSTVCFCVCWSVTPDQNLQSWRWRWWVCVWAPSGFDTEANRSD